MRGKKAPSSLGTNNSSNSFLFFSGTIPHLLSRLIQRVSLEVMEDNVTPKSTTESWNDNLPKLYIHHAAFMKVLGGTLDLDFDAETGQLTPKLIDREGHEMDPNA